VLGCGRAGAGSSRWPAGPRSGFVAGYWTRDPESGRTHATILFDDQAAAPAVKATLDSGRQRAATLGITNYYLILADVITEAHPHQTLD
jgi:hypothetical protein